MARITVTDCLKHVENRFQLVLIAAKRARQLTSGGADPRVVADNDKPTVLALREIAAGCIGPEILDQVSARDHTREPLVPEEELREETTVTLTEE